MATLKLDAYIPSKGEYEKYFDKFRAFMSADLSEKADEQGAYHDEVYEGKGWYPLRSALSGSADRLYSLATKMALSIGLIRTMMMPACVSLLR